MADKTSIMIEAQKYLAKGQIDKAISEWEKLLRESPDGNTHNIIGDLYLKKGDRKNALESFHQAAGIFRAEGFMLKALALYKKVLNLNSGDFEALQALGQLSEEKGLTTDAIKYYLAAADSLSKEGKKDRLLETYEKILSLSPSNIPLRNKVAEIFLKEGLITSAANEYVRIAAIYEEKNETGSALEYLQKAVELQPLNREAALGICSLYERTGDKGKALRHMQEAVVHFNQDSEILLRYAGLCVTAPGYTEAAVNCLETVRALDPGNTTAAMLLGDIYAKDGDTEKALAHYLPAIDEMIMHEEYNEAVGLLERFRDMDPLECGRRLVSLHRRLGENILTSAELVNLGDALLEKELREEALKSYSEALEIIPGQEPIQAKIEELTKPAEAEPVPLPAEDSVEELHDKFDAVEDEPQEEELSEDLPEGGKPADDIFREADIFSRYGLPGEAIKILEGLKIRDPRNVELHMRLRVLYRETSETAAAATECLILSELFKRSGDTESAEKMLQEAYELCPDDPRLAEKGFAAPQSQFASSEAEPEISETEQISDISEYSEEIAEAEFYARQGLTQEALKIFEKLQRLFPENIEIREKLDTLGQVQFENGEDDRGNGLSLHAPQDEPLASGAPSLPDSREMQTPPGFEDFTFTDQDLVDAEEMPEPALDSDVLEIFQEFKKGLEKELGDQDSETHYNLGIAYKEMGLIDDAIKEFQASREDPKRSVPSSTMLGVCYMEKGLYSLAIEVLQKALEGLEKDNESYWPVSYDLAEAYEKSNRKKEALGIYTQVYGWNARFRNVSEKISELGSQPESGPGPEKPQSEKPKPRKDRVSYL